MTRVALAAAVLALAAAAHAQTPEPAAVLRLAQAPRSAQPGDVFILTLQSAHPLRSASASLLDRTFDFYPDGASGSTWRALAGIDVNTSPGTYSVRISAVLADRTPETIERSLVVRPKAFPERHIEVEERYATPPPEVLERIRQEAERLDAIFAGRAPERLWRGSFASPVDAPPSSSFGKRSIVNGKPGSRHTGTDFGAPAGAEVRAPAAGKVVLADELYYSGNTVVVDHGLGLFSFYGHLEKYTVEAGAAVKRGDLLGNVGSTGRSTGPHLHWSIRLAGARVDPLRLMAAAAPRVVPKRPPARRSR
jgi:murein DD-endopeptidase MepM/ murein hydrolase activator NlpD